MPEPITSEHLAKMRRVLDSRGVIPPGAMYALLDEVEKLRAHPTECPATHAVLAPEHHDVFVLRQADDAVKRDLELVHTVCGAHLCDAQPDDDLLVLVEVVASHLRKGCDENGDRTDG